AARTRPEYCAPAAPQVTPPWSARGRSPTVRCSVRAATPVARRPPAAREARAARPAGRAAAGSPQAARHVPVRESSSEASGSSAQALSGRTARAGIPDSVQRRLPPGEHAIVDLGEYLVELPELFGVLPVGLGDGTGLADHRQPLETL